VRGTHFLEMVGVGTGQNMERKEASKGHTLPEEGRHQDCSGHQKKASEQGALTPWRGRIKTGQDMEIK